MNKSATLLPPIPYGLDNAGVLDSSSAAALIKESERAATALLSCAARHGCYFGRSPHCRRMNEQRMNWPAMLCSESRCDN